MRNVDYGDSFISENPGLLVEKEILSFLARSYWADKRYMRRLTQ
ncbi:hypothetical protein [Cohnella sp. REN36]|nr:hypothetical protein [Cohnella sp. REN36]